MRRSLRAAVSGARDEEQPQRLLLVPPKKTPDVAISAGRDALDLYSTTQQTEKRPTAEEDKAIKINIFTVIDNL